MSALWPRRVRGVDTIYFTLTNDTVLLHSSAVFYQDQSKRKETRMILFFVCTKCNHSFTDPSLPQDNRPDTS